MMQAVPNICSSLVGFICTSGLRFRQSVKNGYIPLIKFIFLTGPAEIGTRVFNFTEF